MTTWVYEREQVHQGDIPAKLNERGRAGWELVSLVPYESMPDKPFEPGTTPRIRVLWYIAVYRHPSA